MTEASLQQIEREVEVARAKLAQDLAVLRDPATFSEFTEELKGEALGTKDALVDKAKSSVQSTIDGFVEDLKGRAAANPAATSCRVLFELRPPTTTIVSHSAMSLRNAR